MRQSIQEFLVNQKNPYAAPLSSLENPPANSPMGVDGKFVRQVRVLAILMIVQGVLEALFGVYVAAMAAYMPFAISQTANQNQTAQEAMIGQAMIWYLAVYGAVCLIVATFRIVAGILGLQFRGRLLGIISHILGVLMVITCYCTPTAMAICVYGCIVYFNAEVIDAFQMRASGAKTSDILNKYQRWYSRATPSSHVQN